MLNILIVSKDSAAFTELTAGLSKRDQVAIRQVGSRQAAMEAIAVDRPQVIVAQEDLVDGSARAFIQEMMRRDPFINWALASAMPPSEFHEAMEGLGVFMQLPVCPGAQEADRMLHLLEAIGVWAGE